MQNPIKRSLIKSINKAPTRIPGGHMSIEHRRGNDIIAHDNHGGVIELEQKRVNNLGNGTLTIKVNYDPESRRVSCLELDDFNDNSKLPHDEFGPIPPCSTDDYKGDIADLSTRQLARVAFALSITSMHVG